MDVSGFDDLERARLASLRAVFEIGQCLATLTSSKFSSVSLLDSISAAADSAPPGVRAIWGSLQIRERVGRGRFGDVYRAWDPAIDRHVALKLLRRRPGRPVADSVVVQEGRLMARVRHPNVVTIHGAAHHDGRTGLWMEFIEGRTLEAELRDRGSFDPVEVTQIGIELGRALAAVHAAGLVHRDVKAPNVMREVSGRLVLGDFGTGLEVDDEETAGVALAGTPVYLAPEIFAGRPATPQSDIYSLGVLLFHLTTASFPVVGRSIAEIKRVHANGTRTSLRDLRSDLPAPFTDVVERALEPCSSERFPSAADMERALVETLTAPSPITNRVATSVLRDGTLAWHDWSRGMKLMVGTCLLALAGGLLSTTAWPGLILGFFGPASRSLDTAGVVGSTQNRQLRRVPAPMDHMFWGQPSPDGRSYTFVDMNGDLGVFDTRSGERRRLTDRAYSSGSAYESSTFSVDGSQIAYAWEAADGARELRIIPAGGGKSRLVWRGADEVPHPVDWSQDRGQILCLFERRDGQRVLGVVSVAAAAVTRITAVNSGHSTAILSPDGRYMVFDNGQSADSIDRDIFIAAVGQPSQHASLVAAEGDDFGPLWTPDGDEVLFISDRTGEPSVWTVAVHDGVAADPVILHRNIGRMTPYGISQDGTLYYTLQVGLVDVFQATVDWTREPAFEAPRPVAPPQVGSKINSDWSPDGRSLVYVLLPHAGAGAARGRRLSILDVHTGAIRLLNPPLSYYAFPHWSPDGRSIMVQGTDLASRRGLYLVDPQTGTIEALVVGGSAAPEIGAAAWGLDARTVLFARQKVGLVALDLETRVERQVFDYASEGITTITPSPGFKLSRDGRSIAYSAYRKNAARANETVLRVKDFGQRTRDVVVANLRFEDWTPDGHVLFTQYVPNSNRMTLWRVPATGGAALPVGLELIGLRSIGVHPNGQRITFTSGFPGNELWALEHFLPTSP